MDCLRPVLTLDGFEAFHDSILDKAMFLGGGEQGMLVNDEYNFWYNRVQDFVVLIWDRREKVCMAMDQQESSVELALVQSARSMALSAMAVEYE